tara:strand:- start:522 stop:776 length:255 start_codon:yes stop_codon:yes gene_type:complete
VRIPGAKNLSPPLTGKQKYAVRTAGAKLSGVSRLLEEELRPRTKILNCPKNMRTGFLGMRLSVNNAKKSPTRKITVPCFAVLNV